MSARPVTSTYRLQLRPDSFTLDDARELVGYFDDLGVSHLYLSPVLTAVAGSTHGYDVVDPTSVSAALGGRGALEALSAAVRARGMGLIVDIVPNHMGVSHPRQNAWWWDVLRHGRASRYAHFFDIDWDAGEGRLVLPVLGDENELDGATVERSGPEPLLAVGGQRFPIADDTDAGSGRQVHDRQHYRLVDWRSGRCGYRRFFTVSELAAVRQEDAEVFEATHAEIRSWVADNLIDGLRVDHPDGLTDPVGYLARLRALLGPDRYLVVEKILGPDETLDPALPVDGTTGYDALRELGGVFVDPRGEAGLTALTLARTGQAGDAPWLHAQERALKRAVLGTALRAELGRLLRSLGTGPADATVTEALVELVAAVPVYRADYPGSSGVLGRVVAEVARTRPDLAPALDQVCGDLLRSTEAAGRFAQLCGAATAKAVEDRLFYRATRLVSLQEVGGDPARFAVSTAEFHLAQAERARRWPAAMTTLSTHDTKRGEDVRARIGVLSQVPQLWARCVADWEGRAASPEGAGLFLWQNLFGVWPEDGEVTTGLRTRVHGYAEKALREAAVHTSWDRVDEHYERRVHAWLERVFDGPVANSMSVLVRELAVHGRADALGQKLLQLCGPGVPDVYQGTEFHDDSLVDPDNRRPVDYVARVGTADRLVATPPGGVSWSGVGIDQTKLWVTRTALRLRRERPDSFVGGDYHPVRAAGPLAAHLVGFTRGAPGLAPDVLVLATRHGATRPSAGWRGTTVELPPGTWVDRLTEVPYSGSLSAAELTLPVAMLVRD